MTRWYFYDDFEMGAVFESQARTVTESDVATFAGLSRDFNSLHTDGEFGKTTPFAARIYNQHDKVVVDGEWLHLMKRRIE